MTAPALLAAIARHEAMAIAVSGGVDSMLLAHVAHDTDTAILVVHALSPAVPEDASARVRRHAQTHGWSLKVVDAAELSDPRYTQNPANRCYFCKTNLYGRIAEVTDGAIASGTNVDDLSDVRPGLVAAAERNVVHPFVEAGLGKAEIYALAAARGLTDLAELPAQPCLASRIETGIEVTAEVLRFIEAVECRLRPMLPKQTALRCRVTAAGVAIEVDMVPQGTAAGALAAAAQTLCRAAQRPFLGVRPYRRGSAFLHSADA